jgi:hypothetical protein
MLELNALEPAFSEGLCFFHSALSQYNRYFRYLLLSLKSSISLLLFDLGYEFRASESLCHRKIFILTQGELKAYAILIERPIYLFQFGINSKPLSCLRFHKHFMFNFKSRTFQDSLNPCISPVDFVSGTSNFREPCRFARCASHCNEERRSFQLLKPGIEPDTALMVNGGHRFLCRCEFRIPSRRRFFETMARLGTRRPHGLDEQFNDTAER